MYTNTMQDPARPVKMRGITKEHASTERTRAERKVETRRRLLDAALELVDERGFAALSLRELTRKAGITPAAFYRHFANTDELGLVLVDEAFGTLGAMLRDARTPPSPDAQLIDRSVEVLVRHVRSHPAHFRFLTREMSGGHSTVRQAIRKELQLFRSELAVDLARLPYVQQWPTDDLYLLADLIVQTMVATVPDLLEAEDQGPDAVERVARDARRKLLLIVLGIPHWSP
jgi:AcrR family transcriptional regulator